VAIEAIALPFFDIAAEEYSIILVLFKKEYTPSGLEKRAVPFVGKT